MTIVLLCIGVILLLCSAPSLLLAQNTTVIDSLKKVIETADHDTTKVKLLNQLAREFFGPEPIQALEYSQQAAELAERIGYDNGKADSYDNIARYYWMTSDYPKSLKYLKKKLNIYESQGNKQDMANSYNNIGIIYENQSDYPLALDYFFKSLKLMVELGNERAIATIYNNIGVIYMKQSDYPLALDYYFKALKINEELDNKQELANNYNNIGIIYENQSDYPRALDYHFKSLKIKEELGNKRGMSHSYTNIGSLYTTLYEKVYPIGNSYGDTLDLTGFQKLSGLEKDALLDTAMYYQQKALAIKKELSDEYGMSSSLNGIGSIYAQKKNYLEALKHYHQAVLLADSIGALIEASEAHSGLAECYEKLGNHKLALEHYKQYSTLNDSVFNEEKSKELGKLEASHEYEKQMLEQEKEHEKQQALAAAELKRQRIIGYSFIGGFGLVLILAFVIFRSYRQKKKANQLLEEKNEIIEEKNKDITDSIRYAQNIQEAILPNKEEIKKALPDHFIYFQPRDIVSGDFYWFTKQNGKIHIAACDCTGHGVPGAFVSMIGNDMLNQIIIEKGLEKPGDILTQLNNGVKSVFTREDSEQQAQDGMDMTLCVFDKDLKTLEFAGANNPLLLIQNGELKRIKGDKHAIGGETEIDYKFANHKIDLQKGNTIYIFSDGYQDQFGGVRDKKFGTKRFREFLFSIQDKSMQEQKEIIQKTIMDWKGDSEQVDDILIIGVRV